MPRPVWLAAAFLLSLTSNCQAGPATPPVRQVRPSASLVPANLLRISIEFAAPVAGAVLPRLALERADGSVVDAPFLEQELWSPDGAILTILLHPGRVKTGLFAHEQLGPQLTEGEQVALTLDGRPLVHWTVGPIDSTGPAPAAWTLSTVQAGSRAPLLVKLDGPIDGRDADYLAIADGAGRRVSGKAKLIDGETRWRFIPDTAWEAGDYALVARATLEDPAGNRLGGHFETPIDHPDQARADARIAFSVTRSQRQQHQTNNR